MGTALMRVVDQVEPWSVSEIAVRFGMPTVVFFLGLIYFLSGRSERRALRADAAERGGFGGPPGSSDVGSAEGFGVERTADQISAATRKVLIGLIVMLIAVLTLLGVTFWRIFS